jgi:undecaprenyl-diphosphatase
VNLRRDWRVLAIAVAVVVLPLAVMTRVGWAPLTGLDRRADDDAHALVLSRQWLLSLARGLTHLGDPAVVTALAVLGAIALYATGRRRAAVYLLVVRAVAVIVAFLLKETVRRARPALAHPIAHASGFSFPSGHALGSAAAYASLAVVARGRWAPRSVRALVALGVPVVVAATRVLLGVHFPSDVIAGLVLGWAVAQLVAAAVGPDGG